MRHAFVVSLPRDGCSRGVPEWAEVFPVGIELGHPCDDAGRGGLLGGDPGEVPQVLPGFGNDLRVVAILDFLVAGHDEGGFERGHLVQVGDPLLPFGCTGLGGHHVHLVAGQVPGDDRGQRRDIQDGGFRGVGLADPDDPQLVAFQVKRAGRQQLRQHPLSGLGDLAGEDASQYPARPVRLHPLPAVYLTLNRALGDLSGYWSRRASLSAGEAR